MDCVSDLIKGGASAWGASGGASNFGSGVMTVATLNDFIASAKQRIPLMKSATRTSIANSWFSVFDLAGEPGAGVIAGTSTTAGVVPTDATAGCPIINAFGASASGYVSSVQFSSNVACRIAVFDMLFKAGAYTFNANVALTGQPSFAARVPGADYSGLELWVEQVTAGTGNQAVNVTYTNSAGVTGRTTGATGIAAAPTLGRCWQLPLAAGDAGVQTITNVAGTVATAGTFNVLVMRRLWTGRVPIANSGDVHDMLRTGLPQVYDTSAFRVLVAPDSTSTGVSDIWLTVINL